MTGGTDLLQILTCLMLCAPAAEAKPGEADVVAGRLDNVVFAEGLLDRGLTELLEAFLQGHQPSDAIEKKLLRRIAKLAVYRDQSRPPADRLAAMGEAIAILREVAASNADDPRGLQWRLELGYDLLYRQAEPYWSNLLYGFGTEGDRGKLAALAGEAEWVFKKLAGDVLKLRKAAGDDRGSVPVGWPGWEVTERVGARAGYFCAWARFYRALALPPEAEEQRRRLLDGVTRYVQESGYLDEAHRHTGVGFEVRLLAGMAHRRLGQGEQAERFLRMASEWSSALADRAERKEVLWVVNIARLEEVRLLGEAGRFDAASQAIAELRNWVKVSGQQDNRALPLATGLLEWQLLADRSEAGSDPGAAARLSSAAENVLMDLAGRDERYRETLYGLVYRRLGKVADVSGLSDFEKAALVAGLMSEGEFGRAAGVAELVGQDDSVPAEQLRAEMQFNLAVCRFELGDRLAASGQFADVAEGYPTFSRAEEAAALAVRVAADLFADPTLRQKADVRKAFLRALEVLTGGFGETEQARKWQYDLGYVRQVMGRYGQAAEAYGRVGRDDGRYFEARYWRVVCLMERARKAADGGATAGEVTELYQQAVAAAKQFAGVVEAEAADMMDLERSERLRGMAGDAVVLAAAALSEAPVNDAQGAVDLLSSFERRFGGQRRLIGRALQVRVAALQSLGRLRAAQEVIDELLKTDPGNAGVILAGLLQAAVVRIDQARDGRGDKAATDQAVGLAERMNHWADRQGEKLLREDRLALKLQIAEAYQRGGRFDRALELFEECAELDRQAATDQGGEGEVASSAVLEGQADCLYELGHYDRALGIYQNQLYRRAETGSPVWWRAYLRSLQCHVELHAAAASEAEIRQAKHAWGEVVKSITARRQSQPELGGPALREEFEQLENRVRELLAGMR